MRKNRLISLCMAAVMATGLLAGCGETTETIPSQTPSVTLEQPLEDGTEEGNNFASNNGEKSTPTPSEAVEQPAKDSAKEETGLDYSSMPMEEYERAIWYGFVDKEIAKDKDRTVTWQEYCTMIGNMLSLYDKSLAVQWQEMAALALTSEEEMVRDQGCFTLYRAVELMGEEMNDGGIRSVSTNPGLLPSNDGTLPYSWNYLPFVGYEEGADAWVFEERPDGTFLFGEKYINAAISYCQYRMSICSFETFYDTRKNIIGPLTVEEAAVSVLRLYECKGEPIETYWLTKIDKINEEVAVAGEPEAVTKLREQILNSKTEIVKSDVQIQGKTYTGTAYYVSNNGDDNNDGLTPETAWATINKVNDAILNYGDAVFFERGGIYRGSLYLYEEEGYVTVSAYGEGPKPVLTTAEECSSGAEKWSLWYDKNGVKIWKYYKDCLDCGMIVFEDRMAGHKVTTEWTGTQWINEDGTPFDIAGALKENLDFFSDDGGKMKGVTTFYNIPVDTTAEDVQYGPLYLRCDEGNPGELYDCIELCTMNRVYLENGEYGGYDGTVISGNNGSVCDNICVKYYPMVGINLAQVDRIIQNCEIGWGGGCVQGMEDGIPRGRMGDAIMGMGEQNCAIIGNYIYESAASPVTTETCFNTHFNNVSIRGNLFERTANGITIGIPDDVTFENISIENNIFYLTSVSYSAKSHVKNGQMARCEWSGCFRIPEYDKFINSTIAGNEMYYPLYGFYCVGTEWPTMSDNLYVPSKYTQYFVSVRYDQEVGPYLPSPMEDAEDIMRNVFNDTTSVLKQ